MPDWKRQFTVRALALSTPARLSAVDSRSQHSRLPLASGVDKAEAVQAANGAQAEDTQFLRSKHGVYAEPYEKSLQQRVQIELFSSEAPWQEHKNPPLPQPEQRRNPSSFARAT